MIHVGYGLALLIGLALGLLGGGGSILTIPALVHVMGYPMKVAVPMSLVVVGLTSGVGALAHWRNRNLSVRTVLAFGPSAVVGTLLGAELALRVSERLQLTVFALVLLGAAAWMYVGQKAIAGATARVGAAPDHHKPLVLVGLLGALVGMLTGFVGVGGGFLYVPTLVLLAGLEMQPAIGTSLALIMISCIAGVLRYHGTLGLEWRVIALFTGIALVGVALGSRLARHVSQPVLRKGFAAFLLLMGTLELLFGR